MIKKRYIHFTGILLMAGMIITTLTASTNGSPGGKTNSPGDGASCLQCHGGTLNSGTGSPMIQTNIPAAGYVPGNTYTIGVSISEAGISKFGFELTAEDNANQKTGTFSISNPTETQLVNSGNAVSHTSSGVIGSGSKTWSANWTAPPAGTGTLTFYAIVNSTNNNNNSSGDNIYTYSLSVNENLSTGTATHKTPGLGKVFPSPGKDVFHLEHNQDNLTDEQIKVYSIRGRELEPDRIYIDKNLVTFSIQSASSGIYFLQVKFENGRQFTRKIIKR